MAEASQAVHLWPEVSGGAHCPTGLLGKGQERKEKALLKCRLSVLPGGT